MIQHSPILVLAPHTDDGELGCGGLISHIKQKSKIYFKKK